MILQMVFLKEQYMVESVEKDINDKCCVSSIK